MSQKYFGKFRGVVTDNRDPLQIGRVLARVPAVLEMTDPAWAMPCAPRALPTRTGSGLPKPGANIWVEFENGDMNSPIWSGCFYNNSAETPAALRSR